MSPKIPVADDHTITVYGVSLIIKGLHPDFNASLANNPNTSFNTPATNQRDVAIRNAIAFIHTRVSKKYY